ncbi:MAG: lactonase family protein [Clostridiales bacterium]|nr:lactonase family protein [Clostridiales bacterium]
MDFLIGSLTREGGPGVARVRLARGRLTEVWRDGRLTDPNWLATGPGGRLFAVSSDAPGDAPGCVNELALTREGLTLLARQPTGGSAPCHIGFSPDGRYLLAANYGDGSVAVFPLAGGALGACAQRVSHVGRGPHPTRQAGPHIHQITPVPALPGHVCATDLGTDELVVYRQDADTGRLTERYRVPVPAGEGPRHLAYAPNGRGWLVTELGNRLFPVDFSPESGRVGDGLSTVEQPGSGTAAAIRLSPDGGTAFVSNRGEDSVAVFSLAPFRKTAVWRGVGAKPRDFALLPGGYALAACQGEGVALLADGRRTQLLPMPGAVCVLPLP